MNEAIIAALVLIGFCTLAEGEEMARLLKDVSASTVSGYIEILLSARCVIEDRRRENYVLLTRTIVDEALAARYDQAADAELARLLEAA